MHHPPSKLTYHQHPTPIHDTLARLDWVLQNLQPKRLGIIGTHIGGSLAPMLALTAAQSINAVAALEPICDWTGLDEYCVRSTDDCNAVSKKRGKERDSSPRDLVPLLKARERFFATPERYFDAFASPILFLRDPGMDVPRTFPEYLTGSGYPVPVLKPGVLRGFVGEQVADVGDVRIQYPDSSNSESDAYSNSGSQETNEITNRRRKKTALRWLPYGLDYGLSGRTRLHRTQVLKKLQMALPWVRIFVREDGSPPLSNADNPDNEPEENNYHPQSYAKQRNQTVLSRQADEMVDAMRRACFWGREKGFGEKRVSRAQVSSESWSVCGESSAREWVDERLELAGDGID